nr:MAG TPA: hypothetical protein [Caudoviricetes sp.]
MQSLSVQQRITICHLKLAKLSLIQDSSMK